jgi:hypothetical protein
MAQIHKDGVGTVGGKQWRASESADTKRRGTRGRGAHMNVTFCAVCKNAERIHVAKKYCCSCALKRGFKMVNAGDVGGGAACAKHVMELITSQDPMDLLHQGHAAVHR